MLYVHSTVLHFGTSCQQQKSHGSLWISHYILGSLASQAALAVPALFSVMPVKPLSLSARFQSLMKSDISHGTSPKEETASPEHLSI